MGLPEYYSPCVIRWDGDQYGTFTTSDEHLEFVLGGVCGQPWPAGTHKFVVCKNEFAHRAEIVLRRCGFEIRDSIKWFYSDKGKVCSKTILMGRIPLEGTVAENVLKYGTGALNIDACRVPTDDNLNGGAYAENPSERQHGQSWGADRDNPDTSFRRGGAGNFEQPQGRWPANILHDGSEEVVAFFPETGKSLGGFKAGSTGAFGKSGIYSSASGEKGERTMTGFGDEGSAARFFYNTTNFGIGVEGLVKYLEQLVCPTQQESEDNE